MDSIRIKDKVFVVSIPEKKIQLEVKRVAEEINKDMKGKNPLFLGVLNGAFMFASDLIKNIEIPCEISFIRLQSYTGTSSTGKIKKMLGLSESIKGRTVIIVEDIVDTGFTMKNLIESLKKEEPAEIHIATLLVKPDKLQCPLNIEYAAMNIPNDFIVGYGLDYDGWGRNYKDIYTIVE
jgi:hypoxanthine phosphoribosyltransferase